MINEETAKKFLQEKGLPHPDFNFEEVMIQTLIDYAQQEAKNNEVLDIVMLGLKGKELFPDQIERAKRFFDMLEKEIDEA
jgi:hypothetical protein